MDEKQNYERFDLDNDYEGGEWVGNEYFYRNKKQKHQQTAEDRLYGVFADSDSEGEGRGRKQSRKAADFSKPVGFVSSGVTQDTTQKPEDVMKSEHQTMPAAGAGLGSGPRLGAGGGLGSSSQTPSADEEMQEDQEGLLPTAFGQRIMQSAAQRAKAQAAVRHKEAVRAKPRSGATADIGKFEQHTKGFGQKMLEKMGYVAGQGLGSKGQGISRPVDAKVRPQKAGLGAGGHSEHKLSMEVEQPKAETEAAVKPAQPKTWKKKNAAARSSRQDYKTIADVLNEVAERPLEQPKQTIIDMRGKQKRLVTNMEHLNQEQQEDTADMTPMPELQHNMRLLVDVAEADIQRIDGKLRHEKDTAVILGREQARLQGEVEAAAHQVHSLNQILQTVRQCQSSDASITITDVEQVYSRLKQQHREEYYMYNLAAAALAQASPRLTQLLANWRPLEDPTLGIAEFTRWRHLLESEQQKRNVVFQASGGSSSDPYVQLCSALVMPKLNRVVTNDWEPRNPEPMLQFMELWVPLLPGALQQQVLESLIFPKLCRAVEQWEPRTETVAVHAWLHPWLPYLGPRMDELYPTIRFKLSAALQQWHPSDQSALALLRPWHTVFDAKDWDALVMRSIVPKLAWALQDVLVINPLQQDLAPFHWLTAWHTVLPQHHMVNLLEFRFFPAWHRVLQHWLANTPDFNEVTRWYMGWKSLFPQDLVDHERIRAQFNSALNSMNHAVDGRAVPAWQQAHMEAQPQAAPAQPATYSAYAASGAAQMSGQYMAAAEDLTLRQLVESYAADNDIQLLPKAGQLEEGLQVYAFDKVSIIMDNVKGIIKARVADHWVSVSLEELMAQNTQRKAKLRR